MSTIDPDTQKYFDNYTELFGSEGWKQFIDELTDSLDSDRKTAISRCDTDQKWFEERGQQARTMKILSFETMILNGLSTLQAQEEDDPLED